MWVNNRHAGTINKLVLLMRPQTITQGRGQIESFNGDGIKKFMQIFRDYKQSGAVFSSFRLLCIIALS